MKLANKQPNYNSDINVTPMVDVMLVLLIIFMVVTPMIQHGKTVDMAKTNNQIDMKDADKEDAILVAVMKDGTVYLDTEKVTPETITAKIQTLLEKKADHTVFVKADARSHYGDVVATVDGVRGAGVENLGLLTESIRRAAPPAPAPKK
jgi:biopolymer transport protein TolR